MQHSRRFWRGLFFILLITALCGGMALPIAEGVPARAAPQMQASLQVIINEIGWSGTQFDANDEWIELYNPGTGNINLTGWTLRATDGTPNITLSGTIPPTGFYLLERTDDAVVSDVAADLIYTGALSNTVEVLELRDGSNVLIDTANFGGASWFAGNTVGNFSMERKSVLADSATAWATNDGVIRNGLDGAIPPNPINGTPKQINSATVPLTVTIEQETGQTDPANTVPVNFTVVFSKRINESTFTASDITQSGTANPVTWSITDSGNHINFTLSATSITGNNVTLVPFIAANQVTDLAGNGNAASTSTDNTVTFIDNVSPTVTVNQASGQADPANALPVSFAVVFSEPINTSTFTPADIIQGGTATGITWAITNPTGNLRDFALQATAVTASGALVPSIAAGSVLDQAGNPNTASTSTDNTVTFTVVPALTHIVISEFRTRGPSGAEDEFVEIYNPTSNAVDISGWILSASNSTGSVQNRATIPAATILRSGQYYLLAHNSYSNTAVPPNLRYGTSITDDGGIAILDSATNIIDEVGMHQNSFYQEGTHLSPLPANPANGSYERKAGGAADSCVDTDDNASDFQNATSGTVHNYSSPLSLCGSSRPTVSSSTTTITSDSPDPSSINGNVSVNVTVTGGSTTPSGKVNITGANTNCTLTLNASGTGSCTVKFTSNGAKTLTATYLGDNTHASSSDTEPHQVGTGVVRTPSRTPTPPPPPALIGINEFVPRPGHDWNSDGVINVGDEYIELINHGVIDVNLSGYSLDDEVNIGSNPYRLPSITLKPGDRWVFYGTETGLLLSDGGDGVRLIKPNGQLGDAYNYRVVRFPDQSYCRLPDNGGLDDWNQNCFPTPGLQNSLGSSVNPPTTGDAENLCPIADTLPIDFVVAECPPFGNLWNRYFWDRFGWYGEQFLPESPGKWNVFVD